MVSLATQGREGADNEFFETAAMLITFILLGKYLESAAKGKASNAITQLLTLQPPTALQLETCRDVDRDPTEARSHRPSYPQPLLSTAPPFHRPSTASPFHRASLAQLNTHLAERALAQVPVSGLRRGDVVKVLPGAQVAADGMGLLPQRSFPPS